MDLYPADQKQSHDEFMDIINTCRKIFISKHKEYGPSWRFFRPESVTDQILIKILRIRSIEEKKYQAVEDSIELEWYGVINYCVVYIWLSKYRFDHSALPQTNEFNDTTLYVYDNIVNEIKDLMLRKNHDYGEAWRKLRTTSITDLCLVKINRIIEIEKSLNPNDEIIVSNYMDIVNYAVFASILLKENSN